MGLTTTFAMGIMMAAMAAGVILSHGGKRHHDTRANSAMENSCSDAMAVNSDERNQGEVLLASDDHSHGEATETKAEASALQSYPLDYCIVSGEKLGEMGEPVTRIIDGREVKFCCDMCPAKFEKDQEKFMKKLDDAIIVKQKPNYPLETCIVSGEAFGGEMGDPVDFVYNNQYFKLCCKGCIKNIKKDPEKYMEKLKTAYSTQGKALPVESGTEVKHETHQH